MTEIADTFDKNCFGRGVSTMRLALGYAKGLPKDWSINHVILDYEIPDALPALFPNHRIRVWHSDNNKFGNMRSGLWEYMGSNYETTKEANDWLTGFGYGNKAGTKAHFAIGEPCIYENELLLVFAISLRYTI